MEKEKFEKVEGKKKFEKPELQVVEMERNLLAGTGGGCDMCCGCENND